MTLHMHEYDCETGKCKVCGLTFAAVQLQEQEAKIAAEAKAQADAEAAKIAEEQRMRAENDTTDIHVVPIELNDEPVLNVLGLFFNEYGGITKDMEPQPYIAIKKDVLDRSSGFIIGRFGFEIQNRAKIVFEVYVDGVKVDDFGTNLPYMESSGVYDTVLFKYPNSVKAMRDGNHTIHVQAGLITGIVEKELGLIEWGKVKAHTAADFTIKLLPHERAD